MTPRIPRKLSRTESEDLGIKRNVAFNIPDSAFVLPDESASHCSDDDDDKEVFVDELDDPPPASSTNKSLSKIKTAKAQAQPSKMPRASGGSKTPEPSSSNKVATPRKITRSMSMGAATIAKPVQQKRRPITPEVTPSSKVSGGRTTPTGRSKPSGSGTSTPTNFRTTAGGGATTPTNSRGGTSTPTIARKLPGGNSGSSTLPRKSANSTRGNTDVKPVEGKSGGGSTTGKSKTLPRPGIVSILV